jgi:hypothetical protein
VKFDTFGFVTLPLAIGALRMLLDPNYVTGLFPIFIDGMVLFATRVLMPTMLQRLMDCPAMPGQGAKRASGSFSSRMPIDDMKSIAATR